jgi:hypothetical protein|tara:strand:+ start:1899 stop:2495 length:597 start_codon:yes stop_codon:yes gene_type:complete
MASVVDLCNRALDLLGAANITALTENSKEARLCNGNFDDVRDAVLRSHPWNIAITRTNLAADSTAPAFGFSFQFTLPTDPFCLRVLSFWNSNVNNDVAAYDSNVMFKIEGRKILSNEDTCNIIYIGRITDTEQYDSLLNKAISARLAAEIAYNITGSNSVAANMLSVYEARLKEAKGVDSMEGFPEQPQADDFTNIRL